MHSFVISLFSLFAWLPFLTLANEQYSSGQTYAATNIFTKTKSANALYGTGTTNFNVYRINYTRYLTTSNLNYSTSHTDTIRSIAVSDGEEYVATGGEDSQIQVQLAYNMTKACLFTTTNQVRALVFHPLYEQILYSATIDDVIGKYNITNCSLVTSVSVGASVNAMTISANGSQIYFGTFTGGVGIIDGDLSSYALTTGAHRFAVLYVFNTYTGYFISIGDDSRIILWSSAGTSITLIYNYTGATAEQLMTCNNFGKQQNLDSLLLVGCADTNYVVYTFAVTNLTVYKFTSHGIGGTYSGMTWIDFRSFGGDEQLYVINNATKLFYDRIYDSSSLCGDHLGRDVTTTKTCKMCGYIIPGCHFCTDDTTCTTCGTGTYLSSGLCYRCPIACSKCSSATACSSCAVGYRYNSGGICLAQSTYQAGCFYYNSATSCDSVAVGYYLASSTSRVCSYAITGCIQCSRGSSPSCIACYTGYYLNGTICTLCSTYLPGCSACHDKLNCIKCTVAIKMSGTYTQCSNCDYSCTSCSIHYNNCTSCSSTTRVYNSYNGTCLCKQGYYDAGVATCVLCSSVLTNCYLCTNSSVCQQCQTNYYIYTASSITQCQLCNKNCQTCSGTSTNCLTCNSDSYHRVLSGTTCVCDSGYVSVGSSVPCMACSQLNVGCNACTNSTYCTSCDSGYYIDSVSTAIHLCEECPYYCPDCSLSGSTIVCNSCPSSSYRTLTSGDCPCDTGYFDDNNTVVCQACSTAITNCVQCSNRSKCEVCATGMYTDQAYTLCSTCLSTCLTCGTYYDECTSCDSSTNRVLSGTSCVCMASSYQVGGVCTGCASAIAYCTSCSSAKACTGCTTGYTLASDLKSCIDCTAQINGCTACASATVCTACNSQFTLFQGKCHCPIGKYTSDDNWGTCKQYLITGLQSKLGVEVQSYQHQNNTIVVFIRFRTKTLYVYNQELEDSIFLSINQQNQTIDFAYVSNNHVKITTESVEYLQNPKLTVTFSQNVFYNEDLVTLGDVNETIYPTRLYYYSDSQITGLQNGYKALYYIFYVLKWVFFALTLVGQGYLVFPFVVFIQIMPLFLMMKMSLPGSLTMTLDAMISFQVQSVIPMFTVTSGFNVDFPPITYDYYQLNDFFIFGKIGDIILILLINMMTKFDDGIVRMFPQGRIRRYLYEALVQRGYAVMSFCILSFQPSFILLASGYITFNKFQQKNQIFNYVCCVFAYGFFLAYNFNHASNLNGSKVMKNIDDQQCFLGLNAQEPSASKTTLFVLATDFWIIGAACIIPPVVYFIVSIILLTFRAIIHIRPNFYTGKIHFGCRVIQNLIYLAIYIIIFIFYLSQYSISLTEQKVQTLGFWCTALIFAYLFFLIVQKIVVEFKLEQSSIETKIIQGQNGEQIIFANPDDVQNQKQQQGSQNKQGMREFFNNTNPNKVNNFSSIQFRNRNNQDEEDQVKSVKMANTSGFFDNTMGRTMNANMTNNSSFWNNDNQQTNNNAEMSQTQRMRSSNTSKYARNHLQLRDKARSILTSKELERDQ